VAAMTDQVQSESTSHIERIGKLRAALLVLAVSAVLLMLYAI
jgi:hypothetical protein